ncbi:MAG: HAD-IIA family hydrolase [Thermomicrobiales bacterium]
MRGVLFDLEGVLHVSLERIPGAVDTLRALAARNIPRRFVTNTTTASTSVLGESLRSIHFPIQDDEILTAGSATAEYIHRRWPNARCYLIAKGAVDEDFRRLGIDLVPDDDEATAEVVVIGGAEERLTYERMNRAYRLLTNGARLVAMHRNRHWRTSTGMRLDSGPYVTALEEAAGVRALTIGKPSLPFFRQAVRMLDLPPRQVVMVGDDGKNDLAPARKLGMRTVLVRTGKPVTLEDEAHADLVLDSVAALPDVFNGLFPAD